MRPNFDHYFMGIAREVAKRATCPRKHVGAVIVRGEHLLASGYNGSIRKQPHCEDDGCLIEDNHCVRTVHAELNAIFQAAYHGVAVKGATMYVTASPCRGCFGGIVNSGIVRVVFGEAYRAEDPGPKWVAKTATEVGVELVPLATVTEVDGVHVQHPAGTTVACVGDQIVLTSATPTRPGIIVHTGFGIVVNGKPDPSTCPMCGSLAVVVAGVSWHCAEDRGPCRLA